MIQACPLNNREQKCFVQITHTHVHTHVHTGTHTHMHTRVHCPRMCGMVCLRWCWHPSVYLLIYRKTLPVLFYLKHSQAAVTLGYSPTHTEMPAHFTKLHTIAIALDLHDNGNPWVKLWRLAVKQRTMNKSWGITLESCDGKFWGRRAYPYFVPLWPLFVLGVSRGFNISSEVTPL